MCHPELDSEEIQNGQDGQDGHIHTSNIALSNEQLDQWATQVQLNEGLAQTIAHLNTLLV